MAVLSGLVCAVQGAVLDAEIRRGIIGWRPGAIAKERKGRKGARCDGDGEAEEGELVVVNAVRCGMRRR
jgi:hypothetical protein